MRTNQAESNQTILTKTPIPNTPKSHISTNVVIYNARAKQVAVKGFPHAGAAAHQTRLPPRRPAHQCARPSHHTPEKKGGGIGIRLKVGCSASGRGRLGTCSRRTWRRARARSARGPRTGGSASPVGFLVLGGWDVGGWDVSLRMRGAAGTARKTKRGSLV